MRGTPWIDYHQLGLSIRIEAYQVKHDLGLAQAMSGDVRAGILNLLDAYLECSGMDEKVKSTIYQYCSKGKICQAAYFGIDLNLMWRGKKFSGILPKSAGSALELKLPPITIGSSNHRKSLSHESRISILEQSPDEKGVLEKGRLCLWPLRHKYQ